MTLTPILKLAELGETESSAENDCNENNRVLERMACLQILDRDLTAPPGGESEGDAYIPAATATGAWAGHEDEIAIYINSAWVFQDPADFDVAIAFIYDEKAWYAYSSQESAWHPLQNLWSSTEYWTGEYYGSSKVYAKTIDFGALPNTTTKTVAHGISNLSTIVGHHISADNGTKQQLLPGHTISTSRQVAWDVDGTNINCKTTDDQSAFDAIVTLYYIKSA